MEIHYRRLSKVVIDLKAKGGWCRLPYPGHPKGCPNFNKKKGCPPDVPLFTDLIGPPYYLVGVRFNLRIWAQELKRKHPDWSERQTHCCLYWQGTVRKALRIKCEQMVKKDQVISYTPEAMGVHVFKTCEEHGIYLRQNPQNIVWKIAIIGRRR